MRNLLSIALLVLLVTSCITEKIITVSYDRIIKNTTEYTVKLIININNEPTTYNLAKGDSIIFEGYCEFSDLERCVVGWDEFTPISGRIVFEDEKEIIFSNDVCENSRNPLGRILQFSKCGYLEIAKVNRAEYIYYIDDSDYERAVPIED